MEIGQIIRVLRQGRGETLEKIALDAGTDASNLSRIERGVQQPSKALLHKISTALGVSVESIYARAGQSEIVSGGEDAKLGDLDFTDEAVQLRRVLLDLVIEDRRLVVDFARMLRRRSRE